MVREVSKLMLHCYVKAGSLPLDSNTTKRSKGVVSLVDVLYVFGFMVFFFMFSRNFFQT